MIFAEIVMRPRFLLNTLSVLGAGVMLLACSHPLLRQESGAMAAQASAEADDAYLRGRNLHLARRYDEAIAAYQGALRIDPSHVNARNGLAIVYAEQRDFAKAEPIWRELTKGATTSSGPATAYLFSNLGYAYFLDGQYDQAAVALEKACLLNPLNDRAWQYLGETLQKLGQEERAQQMLRQASALREHDLRADYATTGMPATSPALAQALTTPRASGDWAFVEITGKPGGVLELRRVPSSPSSAAKPTAEPAGASAAKPGAPAIATLEISNGNGRQGFARQLSRQLRDPGVKLVRIANEKRFAVRQTRIEYRPPFRGVAERLAQHLGGGAPVEVTEGANRVDVRLVIGHDLPLQTIAGRSSDFPARHASEVSAL
jgi:tetratricopeptide (TPR) repeat protein